MTKIKQIIPIIASIGLLTSANAADFIKGQYYIGGGVAVENGWSHYGTGAALLINGGKPIIKLGPGTIGAEVELSYTALAASYDNNDYDSDLRVLSLGLFATYKYDINKDLYIRPRIGPMFASYSYGGYSPYHYGYSRGRVATGIGIGYNITKGMNLFSDFTLTNDSYRRISVGLQFKL
jgi:hypothetical protein